MAVKVEIKYHQSNGKFSHSSKEEWSKSDFYCPHCGKQEVWVEEGPGDYYAGEEYVCLDCTSSFNLPSGCGPQDYKLGSPRDQLVKALKAAA